MIHISVSDEEEIVLKITQSDFPRFLNGESMEIMTEIHDRIKSQLQIMEMRKKNPKMKLKLYGNIAVGRWNLKMFLHYIRSKHKEVFGEPLLYINDNQGRTMAALSTLLRWFKGIGLCKEEMREYIDWVYDASEVHVNDLRTLLRKNLRETWAEKREFEINEVTALGMTPKFKKLMGGGK